MRCALTTTHVRRCGPCGRQSSAYHNRSYISLAVIRRRCDAVRTRSDTLLGCGDRVARRTRVASILHQPRRRQTTAEQRTRKTQEVHLVRKRPHIDIDRASRCNATCAPYVIYPTQTAQDRFPVCCPAFLNLSQYRRTRSLHRRRTAASRTTSTDVDQDQLANVTKYSNSRVQTASLCCFDGSSIRSD